MEKTIEKFSFNDVYDGVLRMSQIILNEDYKKKWNEHSDDFFMLTRNGEPIRDTLYRAGAMGGMKEGQDYFMILKYTEDQYKDNITKDPKAKNHLKAQWVILNKEGEEKVVNNQFDSMYLVSNSIIYHVGGKYYNIESGEFYCDASGSSMDSKEYLFLNNTYDNDKSRRGVMRINKKTGEYKLYKEY